MFSTNRVLIPLAKPKKSPRKQQKSRRESKSPGKQRKKKKNVALQQDGFSLQFVTEKIPQYNSLLDKHLINYYANPNIDFMLSFDAKKNKKMKPLKRHSYVNVLAPIKEKKKKSAKELKKVLDFIERENDKVRIRRDQMKYMSDKERLEFKKDLMRKERLRKRFLAVPMHLRAYTLTFLEMRESLQLVQVFGCQLCQETWRLFLITYYKLMVYPIFSQEHLMSTNAGGGVTVMESAGAVTPRGAPRGADASRPQINYYKVFKSCYYNRKSANKFHTSVRLRPFVLKEYERCFTRMPDLEDEDATPTVVVEHPVNGRKHAFQGFDAVFWSHSARVNYADQEKVFLELGPKMLTPLWMGQNVTLFAYGTAKSGKTYQIFGTDTQPGLLPRCAEMIFASIAMNQDPDVDVSVHVSMVELSGGHIVDMFDTSGAPLELINDPVNGAYVDGLKLLPVSKWDEMRKILELQRDENRSCIDTTKRHTIFQITLMQTKYAPESEDVHEERVSTVSFVDLGACSKDDETQTFGVGHALTNLHEVVACMRQRREQKRARKEFKRNARGKGGKSKGVRPPLPAHLQDPILVPFRMSHLTCLLQEGIDRNARVFFIGCLAPSEYAESIKTLEYISTLKKEMPFAIVGGSKASTPGVSRQGSPQRSGTSEMGLIDEHDAPEETNRARVEYGAAKPHRMGMKQNGAAAAARILPGAANVYGGGGLRPRTQTVQDYHRAGGPLAPPGGRSHFRHRAGIASSNRLGAKTALGTVRRPGQRDYIALKRASEPNSGGFLPKLGGMRNNLVTR